MTEQNAKTEKLTDKVFSRLMTSSFIAIFLSLACLCSTTYAWFTTTIPNTGNVISTAKCLLTVSIYPDGAADPTEVLSVGDKLTITEPGTYLITLALPQGSSSGHALISDGETDHYVEYLSAHDLPEGRTLSFTLVCGGKSAVTIEPKWGIYSGEYDISADEILEID